MIFQRFRVPSVRPTSLMLLLGSVSFCAVACRDRAQPPPTLYQGNLGGDGRILMPTMPVEPDPEILNNAGTSIPEIELPPLQGAIKEVKETPEAIYQAFRRYVEIAPTHFEEAMGIGGTFHPDDNKALTGQAVMEIPKILDLVRKIERLLEEKWPEQATRLRQKLTRVYLGSSMKYSAGDPPGILLTIGAPAGRSSRYFVPITQMGERFFITWGFGDLQSRMYQLTADVTELHDQLAADKLTQEEFEERAEQLINGVLKIPFEGNPELANVRGRRPTGPAQEPGEQAARREEAGDDRPSAAVEDAAQDQPAAGSGSLVGGLMKAARKAIQKTRQKQAAESATDTKAGGEKGAENE